MALNNYGINNDGTFYNKATGVIDNGRSTTTFAKVFGLMFAGLLLTAGFAFLFGYIFANVIASNPNGTSIVSGVLLAGSILLIIMTFVIQFAILKKGKSTIPVAVFYTALMGVTLSTLTMYVDWEVLGLAFLITGATFGVLSLIGIISKGRVTGIAMVAMGLLMGAGLVALTTWLFILFAPIRMAATLYWIIDFAVFAAVMLITIVDVARINEICKSGEGSSSLTWFCAFSLYVDFIYIFVRIVYFLLLIFGRSR